MRCDRALILSLSIAVGRGELAIFSDSETCARHFVLFEDRNY